jgi:uncharacterized protein (DUF305 family)
MKFSSHTLLVTGGIIGIFTLAACTPSNDVAMRGETPEHDHSAMTDHSHMTMEEMNQMLEGKTGDEFDKAFLEAMIPHHEGAIDMAQMVEQSAKHQEIKDLAKAIATSQQREIDMMKQWQKDWGYTE